MSSTRRLSPYHRDGRIKIIRFTSIRWRNFLSTGNAWTEIDLDNDGTTLIVGENGSGKSGLLDALCFGLFGKPFRKINKTQLVNTVNAKDCRVEIEFYANNKKYRVERSIKSTTNSGGVFDVYEDDRELDKEAAKKDTQEFLEKNVLKFNFNSFTQIVILGSSTFVPFMQLPAGKRREVIEDLLDIRIFSVMNVLLKERIQDNKYKIEDCKRDIELEKEKLKVHDNYLKELKEANLEKIEELKKEIGEYTKEVEEYENRIVQNKKDIQRIEVEMKENDPEKKIRELENVETKIDERKRKIDKEIDFYEKSNVCPTCHQDIEDDFKANRLEEKRKTKDELERGIESLREKMKILRERHDVFMEKSRSVEKLQNENISHRHKIDSLHDYVARLKREIEETDNTKGDVEDENRKIKELKKGIKKLELDRSELLGNKSILMTASDMLKDKGIKTQIIKRYVPIINKLVNKYLASLDFFVNFELDENFNEVIRSRHRDEFSYESFSEGEKARIDLSLLFAWRAIARMKNSASTNLLILDEVFDGSLDSTGCDEVTKILSTIEEDTNVFVISHKTDQMIDKFRNVIRFEKKKNFSTMVKE